MSAPDYTHGYLRIPHTVWQWVYCRGALTRRQLQLVSVILRESWGWQTRDGRPYLWTRPLTNRQLADATGLSTDHLAGDLRTLLAAGVIRRDGQRFQFVPDAALWITRRGPAPDPRGRARKQRDASAEIALASPAPKKAEIGNRNGPDSTEAGLSPVGDKSGSQTALLADRLVAIVAAFLGPLSPGEAASLRRWVSRSPLGTVWAALEPVLRQPAPEARRHLHQLLSTQGSGDPAAASSLGSRNA